jgi:hypothetical protein
MASTLRFDQWQSTNGISFNPVVQVRTVRLTSSAIMSSPTSWTTVTDGTTPMSITFIPKLVNSLILVQWQLQGVQRCK